MNISQSGYIAAFIFLAFFVFITIKGELPQYAGLLLYSAPSQGGLSGNTKVSSNDTQNQIVSGAITALQTAALLG